MSSCRATNANDRDPLAEATHGPTVDVAIEKMITRLTAMAETRRAALDAALDAGRTAAVGQSDDSDEEP